ncbi:MAG: hypothetical protein QM582_01045 [Micropruina sp.]|uniref:hypothetical protein n=1 Tax=Micropruina sp. TaxID=2737536 RepID=UPI0039E40137
MDFNFWTAPALPPHGFDQEEQVIVPDQVGLDHALRRLEFNEAILNSIADDMRADRTLRRYQSTSGVQSLSVYFEFTDPMPKPWTARINPAGMASLDISMPYQCASNLNVQQADSLFRRSIAAAIAHGLPGFPPVECLNVQPVPVGLVYLSALPRCGGTRARWARSVELDAFAKGARAIGDLLQDALDGRILAPWPMLELAPRVTGKHSDTPTVHQRLFPCEVPPNFHLSDGSTRGNLIVSGYLNAIAMLEEVEAPTLVNALEELAESGQYDYRWLTEPLRLSDFTWVRAEYVEDLDAGRIRAVGSSAGEATASDWYLTGIGAEAVRRMMTPSQDLELASANTGRIRVPGGGWKRFTMRPIET